jgi:hypothetical protein
MEMKKYKARIRERHLEKLSKMKEERDVVRYIENLPFEVHGVEEQVLGDMKGNWRRELKLYTTDYSIMDNFRSTRRDSMDEDLNRNNGDPYGRPDIVMKKYTKVLEFYTEIDENTTAILDNFEIKGNVDVLENYFWSRNSGKRESEVIDDASRIRILREKGIKGSLLERLAKELPDLK